MKEYLLKKSQIPEYEIPQKLKLMKEKYLFVDDWINTLDPELQSHMKALWILILIIYEKAETGRREMLRNLYESIQKSSSKKEPQSTEKLQCFRHEILARLSGIGRVEGKGEKCGFCSGCCSNLTTTTETEGVLIRDKTVRRVNSLLKKRYRAIEDLTKDELKEITEYESDITEEMDLRRNFEMLSTGGIHMFMLIISTVEKKDISILPMIAKKIESGLCSPWYYLLEGYFQKERAQSRFKEAIKLMSSTHYEEDLLRIGEKISTEELIPFQKVFAEWENSDTQGEIPDALRL